MGVDRTGEVGDKLLKGRPLACMGRFYSGVSGKKVERMVEGDWRGRGQGRR